MSSSLRIAESLRSDRCFTGPVGAGLTGGNVLSVGAPGGKGISITGSAGNSWISVIAPGITIAGAAGGNADSPTASGAATTSGACRSHY
jgi:hypothetical protein